MEIKRIYNDPVDENDIANKRYVDKNVKAVVDKTIADTLGKSLGNIIVDDITCKNLFNIQNAEPYDAIITGVGTNSITFVNDGAYAQLKYHFVLKKNTNYVLKYTFETTNPSFIPWVSIQGNNHWGNEIAGKNGTGTHTINFNSGNWDTIDMVFPINGNTNLSNVGTLSNVQLEEGSTPTEYTPYKSLGYTSGSNELGSWVKYDDGRMECWGTGVFSSEGTYEYDSYTTVYFPQIFVGDKNVFEYMPKYMSSVDANITLFTILVGSRRYGAGDFTVENDVVYRRLSNSTNQTPLYSVATEFDWKAKGYWK